MASPTTELGKTAYLLFCEFTSTFLEINVCLAATNVRVSAPYTLEVERKWGVSIISACCTINNYQARPSWFKSDYIQICVCGIVETTKAPEWELMQHYLPHSRHYAPHHQPPTPIHSIFPSCSWHFGHIGRSVSYSVNKQRWKVIAVVSCHFVSLYFVATVNVRFICAQWFGRHRQIMISHDNFLHYFSICIQEPRDEAKNLNINGCITNK